MDIDNVPHVIFACCVLHNVCEVHGDKFKDEWLLEVDTHTAQPDDQQSSSSAQSTCVSGGDQVHVREILIDYFKLHKLRRQLHQNAFKENESKLVVYS